MRNCNCKQHFKNQ